MTPVSAGIYTVEEIHSPFHPFQNIRRGSYSHQICGFLFWQERYHLIQNVIHLLMGFSYCKPSDRIAIQLQLCNTLCMLYSDIGIYRPLINAEQQLSRVNGIFQAIQPCHFLLTPLQPSGSAVHRSLNIGPVCLAGRTFVKCHSYGRCQIGLNAHAFLRPHENLTPIHMGVKIDPLFLNLAQPCKGEHLKTPGIRQYGLIP